MNRRAALQTAGALTAATLLPPAVQAVEPARNRIIAMVAYPGFTALDLIGPYQVLSMLPGFETRIVSKSRDLLTTDSGLTLQPSMTFDECPAAPAVLFLPGGTMATVKAMSEPDLIAFVKSRGATAEYVTSVCTGSLILGAAGLLRGYRAGTHWCAREVLKSFGAEVSTERVVIDRNRITGGGVTAGIDFGLLLASRLVSEEAAQSIQLGIEYDPAPPFHAGSPETAPAAITEKARRRFIPFLKAATRAAEAAAATW
jgi:cyclohexyl-isocyanide hydratase